MEIKNPQHLIGGKVMNKWLNYLKNKWTVY